MPESVDQILEDIKNAKDNAQLVDASQRALMWSKAQIDLRDEMIIHLQSIIALQKQQIALLKQSNER